MTPDQVDHALVRLRVELYTAAQLLKGSQLEEFKQLIREMTQVLDLATTPAPRAQGDE